MTKLKGYNMSERFINPLKEFSDRIVAISTNFPDNLITLLDKHNIRLCTSTVDKSDAGSLVELIGKKPSWIEWNDYRNHYSFFYDFEGNEEIVKDCFGGSLLSNHKFVIMEFGYELPLSKIPLDIFIDYWYELVIISGYESVVMTEDGTLFMEFIRPGYYLKSNFCIKLNN